MWLEGFMIALQPVNLFYLVVGTAFGLVIGALPGLGPMFAVALTLPLTFGMDPASAIILLAAVHAATAYGDSFASILINTPGGVGSVASCWDGYPMAQKGQAGVAMGISALGSFMGGIIGWISLVAISPLLILVALRMGPPEYFMVALMALSLLALASHGQVLKGLFLGGIGLLLAFIGRDPITAEARFTFGYLYLEDGVPLAPTVLGLFALSQVLVLSEQGGSIAQIRTVGRVWEGFKTALRFPGTIARAGIVGIFMGILPALGLSSANIVAYFAEKKASKHPEKFGQGEPRGLLAPEIAKNACIVGDLIPTFTLGIPGSSVTAIFLAAMIMHGLQPGVQFFERSGALPYTVFAGILLAQFSFFLMGLLLARHFAKAVLIPNALLVPLIVMLSVVGSFAMRGFVEDVIVTVVFGFLGYLMTRYRYPGACMVLGLVLGDLVEANFHRSLLIGQGSYGIFFSRPFALAILLLTVILLAWPYLRRLFAGRPLARE
ncbi:MAG: tripartite tricarboxylate transporter permease [Betaproteobacteria bacterium]|nr:tripartite tricarboxylate transporter permease [Betaproteobacteria bacterium]